MPHILSLNFFDQKDGSDQKNVHDQKDQHDRKDGRDQTNPMTQSIFVHFRTHRVEILCSKVLTYKLDHQKLGITLFSQYKSLGDSVIYSYIQYKNVINSIL